MKRREFLTSTAGVLGLLQTLKANQEEIKKNGKSAILLWMGGGPSTMDIWDLKPNAATGGPFRPIGTSGDVQICEHMPLMAKQMHNMAIVRSMSTREADHMRGRYYMHTGYVPNPSIEHPSYGSLLSHQLRRDDIEIPQFVTVGGGSMGAGFLGAQYNPFSVNSDGRIRNLDMKVDARLIQRAYALDLIESNFINQKRGSLAKDHQSVLKQTFNLLTSEQMEAFKIAGEPEPVKERYGDNGFGKGCLMARRLVEVGVPFIEVNLGGWDNHQNIHPTLKDNKLPVLDQGMSALVEDLEQRELLKDTAIIWMGEFSRTPRINGNAGRDHWARSWSVVVGGAGMNGGIAVGATSDDGTKVITDPYTSQDVMASVCKALGISLSTTFTSNSGRPMKIANSGKVIKELFA
ncbi:hypothetical protein CMI37_02910 [Candidatus Pacearchaeota archaeon]|nr:hypothetical protein [Candidatus Pacearchaeota archaeon]|tara:strand:- start:1610 stop:2824 length:1215 start_codon:yes stop_codon:yes gene_type:complete